MRKKIPAKKLKEYMYTVQRVYFQKDNTTVCKIAVIVNLSDLLGGLYSQELFIEIKKRFPQVDINPNTQKVGMEISAMGKSTCSINDAFNEKRGKDIAYAKANKKVLGILCRVILLALSTMLIRCDYLDNVSHKITNAMKREYKFISKF